jgi:hypothetical protein
MLFIIAAIAQGAPAVSEVPVAAQEIRQAVERSLPFLERDGLEWETTKCVSCHHGPWMMWSGYEAKKHGFAVNDASLERVRATMLKAYDSHPKMQPTTRDVLHDLSINVIYLILGMGTAGEPDAQTAKFFDKAAAHLLEQQKEDGSWKVFIKTKTFEGLMPPLIDHDDVTTLWSLLALNYREPSGISREALDRSKEKGLRFLNDHPSSEVLQSLVLRIMLSQRLGKTDDVKVLVTQLLALQKDDGGWSQETKLPADSLGTGQALVALSTTSLTASAPAIAKALAYLVRSQKADGSWDVISRAHEGPRFCSYMGTAWATLGMVRTLPETKDASVGAAGPARGRPHGESSAACAADW